MNKFITYLQKLSTSSDYEEVTIVGNCSSNEVEGCAEGCIVKNLSNMTEGTGCFSCPKCGGSLLINDELSTDDKSNTNEISKEGLLDFDDPSFDISF